MLCLFFVEGAVVCLADVSVMLLHWSHIRASTASCLHRLSFKVCLCKGRIIILI